MNDEQLKRLLIGVLAVAMLCFVTFMCGIHVGKRRGSAQPTLQTERSVTTVYDTAFIDMPIARDSVVTRYVTARLPLSNSQCTIHNSQLKNDSVRRDTVEVELPLTLTEYSDSNYVAWVSGYMASLDSIKVINRTEVIRETVRETTRKRWSFTVGPTVGAGWNGHDIQPYVGVGLTWGWSF